ncbi:MAG: T9SS type A sorting domain-containing protein [Ignavibacteriales bacterium]|nr:T9SS type A sorting domain-containing protein [Ignavibacteriales bacterium]
MKQLLSLLPAFLLASAAILAQEQRPLATALPGFTISPYFNEQVLTYVYTPTVRVHINAPSRESFDPAKPTALAFFALPNGNTIEMTVGRKLNPGDDWHYDIQHIGAQTRFIRSKVSEYNFVTIYLEANAPSVRLSWGTWNSTYSNHAALVKSLVDSVTAMFAAYQPFVVLSSHSGGGGFEFSYLDAVTAIPNEVKRIAFLDSDYNYTNTYGQKLRDWVNAGSDHYLSVLAYNDSIALLDGVPIVSATGGTWYRTRVMAAYLSNYYSFTIDSNATFITHTALGGRIKIILKQNPAKAILHTVQVELNGFVQTMLSGTQYEGGGYTYYGSRAYSSLIQSARALPRPLQIPPRPAGAMTGSQFMTSVAGMTFDQREAQIYAQASQGNIPDFMRTTKKIQSVFQDVNGLSHTVIYEVMPDYLCIGSNTDFCRIPTGPITAQKLANLFGATMPTSKLVDDIYVNADVKLAPVTYDPNVYQISSLPIFVQHNSAIEVQRATAGKPLGALVGGIKKDVVISNKIVDPANPNHVVIYGWHQLNGLPIQPLYNGHVNYYVDYSHGIRFINNELLVDSVVMTATTMMMDATLYKVLSNETGAMTQASYLKDSIPAATPAAPKSFGIKTESSSSLRVVVKPDSGIVAYTVAYSKNGSTFSDTITLAPDNLLLTNLGKDTLYYVKIKAVNSAGASPYSELLAGIPCAAAPKILIVNGFDRASTGNTYNFIRQHGSAVTANGGTFNSATNDAILDGLFALTDYKMADYILGDESTADETFSAAEQTKVREFLQGGGSLFASGSELAWDLDSKGTTTDKDFANNYLKLKYGADAPNGVSATTYQAEILGGPVFSSLAVPFDNGSHGSIDVKWPDVLLPNAGGIGFAKYTGLDTSSGYSGVYYAGMFPSGAKEGKVVAMGFPFETIYTTGIRVPLMGQIMNFFAVPTVVKREELVPAAFTLAQNFPNPFNPSTTIRFTIPSREHVLLAVYDIAGRRVATLVDDDCASGFHEVRWNAKGNASGVYLYTLRTATQIFSRSMILMK